MTEQEKIQHYDALINITIQNIYTISKSNNKIIVLGFDPCDEEHLFFIEVALMASDLFGMPVYIGGLKNFLKLNWQIRKTHKPVKLLTNKITGNPIEVPKILEFERPDGINNIHPNFTFAEIYTAFYKKRGNK